MAVSCYAYFYFFWGVGGIQYNYKLRKKQILRIKKSVKNKEITSSISSFNFYPSQQKVFTLWARATLQTPPKLIFKLSRDHLFIIYIFIANFSFSFTFVLLFTDAFESLFICFHSYFREFHAWRASANASEATRNPRRRRHTFGRSQSLSNYLCIITVSLPPARPSSLPNRFPAPADLLLSRH